jgi:hypothetical protein
MLLLVVTCAATFRLAVPAGQASALAQGPPTATQPPPQGTGQGQPGKTLEDLKKVQGLPFTKIDEPRDRLVCF